MRRAARNRLIVYGGIVSVVGGGYLYQPVRIDLFPRPVPVPNPEVDPDAKSLFASAARVVVVTAHPDDSEYYAGGLLAKLHRTGAVVRLIVLTDGDKGYEPWENAERNRRVRRAEEVEAARAWGAARVDFLAYPDGRLGAGDRAIARVAELARGSRWMITFDGDYPIKVAHRDHRVAGEIGEAAARLVGIPWVVRFATHAANGTFDLTGFEDAHRALVDCHRSQFSGQKEEGVWNAIFETGLTAGERIGASYGLSFRASRLDARP